MHKGENMKKVIFVLIIVLSLFLFFKSTYAQLNDVQKQEMVFKNFFVNGGFENGKANWSVSGGTFTLVTSGSNLALGKASAAWTPSGSGQNFDSVDVVIPNALKNQNCEINFLYSGGDASFKAQVLSSSNVLTEVPLTIATSYKEVALPFICPSSGSIKIRITTTAATTTTIYLDEFYFGKNFRIGSAQNASLYGLVKITGCSGWTTNANGSFPQNTSCTYSAIGNAQIPSTKIPKATFTNLSYGVYYIAITGALARAIDSTVACSVYLLFNNKNMHLVLPQGGFRNNGLFAATQKIDSFMSSVDAEVLNSISGGSGNCSYEITDSSEGLTIALYRFPLETEKQIVSIQDNPDYFEAKINAAADGSTNATTTTFGIFTDNDLQMTPASYSSPIGIACNNAASVIGQYTCPSSNEAVGATFQISKTGVYEVCMNVVNYGSGLSDEGNIYKIAITQNNSNTIVIDGDREVSTSRTNNLGISTRVCNRFKLDTIGQYTAKLFGKQYGTAAALRHNPTDIFSTITIKRILPSIQTPIFLGSISSANQATAFRIEAARIGGSGSQQACNTSTCTIYENTSNFISSVNRTSTGNYIINFSPSFWKNIPVCIASSSGLTIDGYISYCFAYTPTNMNNVTVTCVYNASNTGGAGNNQDSSFRIICMGER
jgi:hypothetical protein